MFLIGFKVQDPSSTQQKTYVAVATSTGYCHTASQGTGRPTYRRANAIGDSGTTNATELAKAPWRALQSKWNEKTNHKSYSNILIQPIVIDDSGLSEEDSKDARKTIEYFEVESKNPTGGHVRADEPRKLGQMFVKGQLSQAAQSPVVAPRAQAVDQRDPMIKGEPEYYRPNGQIYRPRDLGGHHDVALLKHLRTAGIPVRLYGLPGTGKSALAEAAFGRDLITINGHGDMTVSHFVGSYLPQNDGTFKWADGPLTRAMKEGRPLFVDEITRIPSEVLAVLYSVLDGRGTLSLDDKPDAPVVQAKPGFYALCGYNPEGIGVRQLDDALVSRFAVPVEVTTDLDAAKALGVPAKFIRLAENLRTKDAEDRKAGGAGVWVPQMRELLLASTVAKTAGVMFAASVIAGQCPRPEDVPTVTEVASKVFGASVKALALGGQV
ncbi:MAG TPA: AAA family ATPase [Streptomyces sp.]|uniref:AAA family ATPase n=1 Tax=Streptomyces TaxID=1883 RepID=UPI00139DF9AB|nr:AAA family ATPase [Streptomyces sp.]MYT26877.1 AAA domain-containing protein [Streptomyces sp. SID7760]HWU09676.1 AAA family ATPase [Streptomyces sp.]